MHGVQCDQLFRMRPLMAARTITIGTRGSQLALWQANWVKVAIAEKHPDLSVELAIIKTRGEKVSPVEVEHVQG